MLPEMVCTGDGANDRQDMSPVMDSQTHMGNYAVHEMCVLEGTSSMQKVFPLMDTELQMETDATCKEHHNAQELTSELESEVEMEEVFAVPEGSGPQLQEQSSLQEPSCRQGPTWMQPLQCSTWHQKKKRSPPLPTPELRQLLQYFRMEVTPRTRMPRSFATRIN